MLLSDVATGLSSDVPGTSFFVFGYADPMRRGLVERRKAVKWFSSTPHKGLHDIGSEPCARYGLTG